MLKSMLVNKGFLTWILIGWLLTDSQLEAILKFWLTKMDFDIEISLFSWPLFYFCYMSQTKFGLTAIEC